MHHAAHRGHRTKHHEHHHEHHYEHHKPTWARKWKLQVPVLWTGAYLLALAAATAGVLAADPVVISATLLAKAGCVVAAVMGLVLVCRLPPHSQWGSFCDLKGRLLVWALMPLGYALLALGSGALWVGLGSRGWDMSINGLRDDCAFGTDFVWRVQRCEHRSYRFFDGHVYEEWATYASDRSHHADGHFLEKVAAYVRGDRRTLGELLARSYVVAPIGFHEPNEIGDPYGVLIVAFAVGRGALVPGYCGTDICGVPVWGDVSRYKWAASQAMKLYNFSGVPLDADGMPNAPFLRVAPPNELVAGWLQSFSAGAACLVTHALVTLALALISRSGWPNAVDEDSSDGYETVSDSSDDGPAAGCNSATPLVTGR